jgi:cobalamin-dependent methionine synthase I
MLIIGERINGTRKRIGEAIRSRDAGRIVKEAKRQVAAGAGYLDVNAGTVGDKEVEDMRWLVETVRAAVDVPLCVDSPNPDALRAGLEIAGDDPMVNSITGEKQRIEDIVPIVKEFDTRVVCLLMDDTGLLSGVDERTKLAADLTSALEKEGIGNERLHFDPCVMPVSTEPDQGASGLAVVSWISKELPGVHTTCGLSNVSFGLPNRSALNAAYLAMMVSAGLDSVIIDPLNETVMDSLMSARALVGQDEMCLEYIQAARSK